MLSPPAASSQMPTRQVGCAAELRTEESAPCKLAWQPVSQAGYEACVLHPNTAFRRRTVSSHLKWAWLPQS